MNTREISALLEKYYSGEATDDEERKLRQFFKSGIVPDELSDEVEIFSYYSEENTVPEPSAGFEKRIIEAVDRSNGSKVFLRTTKGLYTIAGIAAGLLILIGSYFFIENGRTAKDTFTDPQLAYSETVKILFEVSSRLNKGTQALDQIKKFQEASSAGLDALEKSAGTINRNLKNLDYFQRMIDIADSPMEMGKIRTR